MAVTTALNEVMQVSEAISAKFPSIREAAKRGPLSEYCLRLMLKQGKLPGVFSGRKFLVNYERLLEWLDAEGGNVE